MAPPITKEKLVKTGRMIHNGREVVAPVYMALAAVDTGGGVLAWQNPYTFDLIILRLILDVTTHATGACTVDAGVTSTSAVTSSDSLIDGLDIGTAAILADNLGNAGTNGKSRQVLPAGKWLTISKASGATAGIVGNAIIIAIPRN